VASQHRPYWKEEWASKGLRRFSRPKLSMPKDDFPIPITEMVVDSTTGHGALSFMDGSSGYNQIKMDEDDAIDTTFRTPRGNFQYIVMPFGLKNDGATYQLAMTHVLCDLIHQSMECYVDDMVVKTRIGRTIKRIFVSSLNSYANMNSRWTHSSAPSLLNQACFLGSLFATVGLKLSLRKLQPSW